MRKKKNFAIIIQARLTSSRFKEKILKKILGKQTLIDYLVNRLLLVFKEHNIIFAIAKNKNNYKIINILKKYNIKYFVGSEKNVLNRYLNCAVKYKIDNIIRITSDCPFVDPYLIYKMLKYYRKNRYDYFANTLPENLKKYPDGSDIEIFSYNVLEKISRSDLSKADKEHVTNKLWSSKKIKKKILFPKFDYSNFRFSVDYPSDLILVKYIAKKIHEKKIIGTSGQITKIIKKSKYITKIMHQNIFKQKNRRKGIFI